MELDRSTPLRVVETMIEGTYFTRNDTIERELQNLYRASTLEAVAANALKAADNLEHLGIFENVEVELLPGKRRGEAGLRVSVKEKRMLSLRATTFVEQGEGGVELSTKALNALGRAESLELGAIMGGSELKGTPGKTQLRLDYNQPKLLGTPFLLNVSADSTSFQPVGEHNFEDVSYGISVGVRAPFGLNLEWNARQRDIIPARRAINKEDEGGMFTYIASPEILADARPSLKSSITLQLVRNALFPSSVFPITGNAFAIRMELASPKLTGGNVDLLSISGRLKQSFPITSEVSVTASFEAGVVRPLNGDYLYIQDRLFLGGPMFLRGFLPRGAGRRTVDGKSSLGGRNRWQARLGIEGPSPEWTRLPSAARAHIFVAAGALSDEFSIHSLVYNDARVSLGCGFAFGIASARFEANAVYIAKADKGDATSGRLQFGIGGEFL